MSTDNYDGCDNGLGRFWCQLAELMPRDVHGFHQAFSALVEEARAERVAVWSLYNKHTSLHAMINS